MMKTVVALKMDCAILIDTSGLIVNYDIDIHAYSRAST